MGKKWVIILIVILLFGAFLTWLFIASSKPLPGTKIADLGRGHVSAGTNVKYNSNPPTSGQHYEDWIKAGVYDDQKDDRNLVHSLEHGYIIMTYKCQNPMGGEASGSASLSDDCKVRRDELAKIYEKKGKHKLIVTPRANLETSFVLTAWDYLDKFNDFNEERIVKFIDAHLDQGPEHTMEP